MSETVYLNGDFLPLEEASVPVLDRGFIFGDGVYELLPAYSRVLFRLDEHLARLNNSLIAVGINNPFSTAQWTDLLNEVIRRNVWDDQSVYVQVTRGVARRDQAFPQPPVAPTIFVMASAMRLPSAAQRREGVAVITREDYRWARCDIKTTSLIANCMLRQEAVDNDCAEVVLLRQGMLTEGSSSNVLLVKDRVIIAPPKDNLILPGVTYDLALELARLNDLPCEVRPVSVAELYAADEIWLSSSLREVIAVTTVDGMPVNEGRPGPIYQRIYELYQNYKTQTIAYADHG